MSDRAIIRSPNYTQVPNDIFTLLPLMKEAELKVTMVIIRATFGWQQGGNAALISITDMMERAGLSRQGVLNGLADGMERGLLYHQKGAGGRKSAYGLTVHEVDTPEILTESHKGSSVYLVDQGSQRSRPSSVYLVDRANGSQAAPGARKPDPERKIKESNKEQKIPTPVGMETVGVRAKQKQADAEQVNDSAIPSALAKDVEGGQAAEASKQAPSSPDAAAPPSSPKVKSETPAQMLIFGLAKPWVMRGSPSEEGLSEVAFTRMRSSIGKVASELTGVGVTTEAGFQEFLGYMLDRHFHGLHREGEKINFGTWKNAADGYVQWAADGKKAAPSSAGSGKNDKVTAQLKAAREKQATAIVAEVNSEQVVVEGDDGVLKW